MKDGPNRWLIERGRGARWVAAGAREKRSDLIVVQDPSVPIVSHADLVGRFHVGGRREVAADPGSQPCPRVGSDWQSCPVQSPQRGVFPVKILAPVRGEEGVGDARLEDRELGPGLQVDGLPDVEFERGVVSSNPFSRIDVDRRGHPFPSAEETPSR